MKADIDLVNLILQRNDIDVRKRNQIIEDIQTELQANSDEEQAPPIKKQFVIVVSDPEGKIEGLDLTGWVVQIPEEDSVFSTAERIHKAAYDFNASPKGKRLPVRSIGEALEVIPAKFFKEHQAWVKTKEPVLLISTKNELPRDRDTIRKSDLED